MTLKRNFFPKLTHIKLYFLRENLNRFLDALQDSYPNVNVKSIGKTFEGRDIKVVVVNEGKGLPKLFIDAGIHAREWISPAATLFFLDRLTKVLSR